MGKKNIRRSNKREFFISRCCVGKVDAWWSVATTISGIWSVEGNKLGNPIDGQNWWIAV
jgi:hypothetical protein